MKKYVIPATKLVTIDLHSFVCVSGKFKASWGAKSNEHANEAWYDEGWSTNDDGEEIENDRGLLDSQ